MNIQDLLNEDDDDVLDDTNLVVKPVDPRYVEGINCTFHGSISMAMEQKTSRDYIILVCPLCGGGLKVFETFDQWCPDYEKWKRIYPNLDDYHRYQQKDCSPTVIDAKAKFRAVFGVDVERKALEK